MNLSRRNAIAGGILILATIYFVARGQALKFSSKGMVRLASLAILLVVGVFLWPSEWLDAPLTETTET